MRTYCIQASPDRFLHRNLHSRTVLWRVIEAAFGIVVVASVTERVLFGQSASGGQNLAVGVVGITCYGIPASVHQSHDIALQVGHIIVGGPIDLHGVGLAGVVVEEVVGLGGPVGRYLLLLQLAVCVDITVGNGSLGLQNSVGTLCSSDAFLAVTNTIQRPSAK